MLGPEVRQEGLPDPAEAAQSVRVAPVARVARETLAVPAALAAPVARAAAYRAPCNTKPLPRTALMSRRRIRINASKTSALQ